MEIKLTISWPVRIAVALFVAVLVTYLGTVTLLNTAWSHRLIAKYLVNRIEETTGTKAEIARLDLHPVAFRVTLHGLILHGKERPTQEPLLKARTLDVTLNPIFLASRKLYLQRFDATGLKIHLYTAPDGSTNLPESGQTPGKRASRVLSDLVNLHIRAFSISQSSLDWNDQRIPLNVAAENMALLLSPGREHTYTGSFSTSNLQCAALGRNFPSISVSARVRVSSRQIALNHLIWRTEAGAGTGAATVELAETPKVHFSLLGKARLAPLTRALGIPSIRNGDVSFTTKGSYSQGSLLAWGMADGRNLMMNLKDFNPGLADLSAHFQIDGTRLDLSQVRARLLGGEAKGKATMELSGPAPRLNFRGTVKDIDLAAFIQAIPGGEKASNLLEVDSGIGGKLGLLYDATPGEFRADFDVQGSPNSTHPDAFRPLTGSASGSLTIGKMFQLQVASANVQMPHSSLKAQGLVTNRDSNLEFQYHTTDFEESRKFVEFLEKPRKPIPLALKSEAHFSGTLQGSATRPELHGKMDCGPFRYAGYLWQAFSGNVVLSPRLGQVSGGRLLAGKSVFTFDLQTSLTDWQVTSNSRIRADAQARQSPLEGIQDAFGFAYPVSGLLNGSVAFEGTPANLAGQGKVEIRQAEFAGEPFDLFLAQATIANSVLDVIKMELDKGQGKLTGDGRLDLVQRTFSMILNGRFSLAEFRRLIPPAYRQENPKTIRSLEGAATLHLQGTGSLHNPEADAALDIPDLSVQGSSEGHFELKLHLKAKDAQLLASLNGPQGTAVVHASAKTEGDWPTQFSGQLNKVRVDTAIGWFENVTSKTQLRVSGSFNGHGLLRKPSTLVMAGNFQEVNAAVGGLTWKNRLPVHLDYADRKLTAIPFQLSGPSTDLQLGGSLELTHPVKLDLQLSGHSDATFLHLFDPSLQAAGGFDVELTARGTMGNPELSGAIEVKDLGIGYANVPFRVAGLNGKIELLGNHANIISLGSRSGQSSIQVSGFAAFGANPRYDLKADLRRARIGFPTDFTSILSGHVEISGTERAGQLSGNLNVTQMFAREGFNLLSWLGRMGTPAPPTPSVTSPFASRIQLNMILGTAPDVSLESHDLSFVAVINSSVHGTLASPVVLGTIHMRSGRALIRGNRYTINRGDITMTSPVRTQPVLDLQATTRVDNYNLTLDVAGPLDRAKIAYRSDPPLPTEDILSLLALGYAPQLQQLHPGGAQPAAAVGASAILSQALSSQFSGRVQRILGVSRIRIDPNLIGPTTAGGARITIEEQVAPDVTLTYATNTGAAQQRDIRLEWDLSDRVSLIGERDINGVFGVEIRFRRRFK